MSSIHSLESSIKKILPLRANSILTSDNWVIEFEEGTVINGKPVKSALVKLFINPESFVKTKSYNDIVVTSGCGMQYEIAIYRDIISKLSLICPHFIEFITTCNDTADNLIEILTKFNPTSTKNITHELFERNALYMANQMENRPNLYEKTNEKFKADEETILLNANGVKYNSNWTYSSLLRQLAPYPGITLFDFISTNYEELQFGFKNPISENSQMTNLWTILFQTAIAAFTYSSAGLNHNNLHDKNIFVGVNKRKTQTTYNIVPVSDYAKSYTMETQFLVKIYDYNRSFVKILKKNYSLNTSTCNDAFQCNKFNNFPWDMVRLYYNICRKFADSGLYFSRLLSVDGKDNLTIEQVLVSSNLPNKSAIDSLTKLMCTYPVLINRLAQWARVKRSNTLNENANFTINQEELNAVFSGEKYDYTKLSYCNKYDELETKPKFVQKLPQMQIPEFKIEVESLFKQLPHTDKVKYWEKIRNTKENNQRKKQERAKRLFLQPLNGDVLHETRKAPYRKDLALLLEREKQGLKNTKKEIDEYYEKLKQIKTVDYYTDNKFRMKEPTKIRFNKLLDEFDKENAFSIKKKIEWVQTKIKGNEEKKRERLERLNKVPNTYNELLVWITEHLSILNEKF